VNYSVEEDGEYDISRKGDEVELCLEPVEGGTSREDLIEATKMMPV